MVYHDLPQPYRIQKRLALNQCFRAIKECGAIGDSFVYVTFGGEDLYDAMDLVAVFDVRSHNIRIISYEFDETRAEKSQNGYVATTLSRVASITVDIVAAAFPSVTTQLEERRGVGPFIYFLDYTGTVRDREADDIAGLCEAELLRPGDYLLVTSCLTPRVLHNARIMKKFDPSYRLWFKGAKLTDAFRDRNHVDLFVNRALTRVEAGSRADGEPVVLVANRMAKFRYQDSRSPMGLWAYRLEAADRLRTSLEDAEFEDFPEAFVKLAEPDVPNIFD